MTLQLRINGEARSFDDVETLSVRDLLERLNVDTRHVAVERNRELVPKRGFEEAVLKDGDELEIVTLVGGG